MTDAHRNYPKATAHTSSESKEAKQNMRRKCDQTCFFLLVRHMY